jgi:tripartite-type tricarboxylate transporter receptor subunit TctC
MRRRTFTILGAVAALPRSAVAQTPGWPARPIHIVCGFSVGTTTDLLARLLADRLGTRLQNPVVVENRPGAGGTIAAAQVARAAADGHTLMLGSLALTLAPRLYKNVTFKPAPGLRADRPGRHRTQRRAGRTHGVDRLDRRAP